MWWWLSEALSCTDLCTELHPEYSTANIDNPTRNLKGNSNLSKMELRANLLSKIRSSSVLHTYESLHHPSMNSGFTLEAILSPFHIKFITESCWTGSYISLQTAQFSSSPWLPSKLQLHPLLPRWLHWLPTWSDHGFHESSPFWS